MISMFEEGDTVFLVGEDGRKHWAKVSFKMLKIPSLGTLDGSKLESKGDGCKIKIAGKEFTVFVPGTVDLMESLERGAQVITPKDAATILLYCDIKPGDTVLEVGAGSGGLTTALCAAVSEKGKVFTLELDEGNANRALRNLKRAALAGRWSFVIGDAREKDPGVVADALIMDMPDPEKALPNLDKNLRPGGRVCAYIPNTNQVQNVAECMRSMGFFDVFALENIQREMVVHPGGVRPAFDGLGHTGYLVFGRKRQA